MKLEKQIVVTTGDIKEPYTIIGPVYYQISNKGFFSSELSKLTKEYKKELDELRESNQVGAEKTDWGVLYGELSVGQNDFDTAFFISVMELRKRAKLLGATAIISMRQDIDIDTNGFQFFYLQMYGTAIKHIKLDINAQGLGGAHGMGVKPINENYNPPNALEYNI